MNYGKLICLALILVCSFLSMSVMAQNQVTCNPNSGNNCRGAADNIARSKPAGKRLIIYGYGSSEDRASCAGYMLAYDFLNNVLRKRLFNYGVQIKSIEIFDGGYLKETEIKVFILGLNEKLPKLDPPVRRPTGEDCSK